MLLKKAIAISLSLTFLCGLVQTADHRSPQCMTAVAEGEENPAAVTFDETTGTVRLSGNIEAGAAREYAKNHNVKKVVADEGTVLPENCNELFMDYEAEEIDLSKADTSNVVNMQKMFSGCMNLKSLDISGFDTSHVTKMSDMFRDCRSLESLDLTGFDTSNVTDMSFMFIQCFKLTSLDVSGFDTSKVVDMRGMFDACESVSSLDLKNFDTSNVTAMGDMFGTCLSLTSLDLSSFDTSAVTDFRYMFLNCPSLRTIDLSSFDTSSAINMTEMFKDCKSLESLDVSGFETSKVVNMSGMFEGCSSLTSLDLSSFDCSNVIYFRRMFGYCRSLKSLDLSSFDTSNAKEMTEMFRDCQALERIIVSDKWNNTNVSESTKMFFNCRELKGGNGTAYDKGYTDVTYAVIDKEGKPGYFTAYSSEMTTSATTQQTVTSTTTTSVTGTDLPKPVKYGDANCDGEVDMADAVIIMQSIANPDKYGINGTAEHHLTEQGKVNGDMDGNGLTVGDAQLIQMKLLGMYKETDSDIVVFEMAPSKEGVEEFHAKNPTLISSYEDDELFNITPQEITDKYGFRIFKYSKNCDTYLELKGETYPLGIGFGGPGTISFAVADLNGDEQYELYFTYSFGSGLNRAVVGCFDITLSFKFEGLDEYSTDDFVLALENGKLGVYKAKYISSEFVSIKAEPTEKLGEIIADNEAHKVTFVSVNSSNTDIDKSAIAGKTFVYEKEGTGSEFTITLNADGTFEYYTGVLSSYLGGGTWEIKDDTVVMTESTSDKVQYLKIQGSDLVYIADRSDNFYGVRVNEGEKFCLQSPEE